MCRCSGRLCCRLCFAHRDRSLRCQVRADHTAPEVSTLSTVPIRDGTLLDDDIDVVSDATELSVNWNEFTDSESGISMYETVVTRCGTNGQVGIPVNEWTEVVDANILVDTTTNGVVVRTMTMKGLQLYSGTTYVLCRQTLLGEQD